MKKYLFSLLILVFGLALVSAQHLITKRKSFTDLNSLAQTVYLPSEDSIILRKESVDPCRPDQKELQCPTLYFAYKHLDKNVREQLKESLIKRGFIQDLSDTSNRTYYLQENLNKYVALVSSDQTEILAGLSLIKIPE